jgi:hypothetical protein
VKCCIEIIKQFETFNIVILSLFVHCFEDSLDNTLFVLYIYDDDIIDICFVLVWNFVSCIRRIKSVQKAN